LIKEYYPLEDAAVEQYWKLKVINGKLQLEENTEAESESNPVINDKDGTTTWVLSIDNGRLVLADTTAQPDTQFYLRDLAGDIWQVIVNNGVIGVEKVSKKQSVLDLSCYPLDCRSSGWVDLSGSGNHGVPHGGARPYMVTPGVMGFEIDGDSGYVDCGDDTSLAVVNRITIGVWVISQVDRGHIVCKYRPSYGDGDYDLVTKYFSLYIDGLGYPDGYKRVEYTLPKGRLIYVTAIYDGAYMKVYLDGLEEASLNIGPHTIDNSERQLFVGANVLHTVKYPFKGLIAALVIENRAWSSDEIRENMYRSPVYRMLRGLPHSMIYTKVPWKQTQGGIYVP